MLTTFSNRAAAGAQALSAAMKRGLREPERAAYLAAAETTIWASLFSCRGVKQVVKPMLLPSLSGRVLRSGASESERAVGLMGLAGGLFGDVVLLRSARLPQGNGLPGSQSIMRPTAGCGGDAARAPAWAA